jgi:mono/diheme cytochrome c family protein
VGKVGKALYDADCAICHDDVHRAAMVPDLHVPRSHRDLAFWKTWIGEGKPGTMMPAFHTSQGGPLTQEQVDSLAAYLFETMPKNPPTTAAAHAQLAPLPPPPVATPAAQKN